MINIKFRISFTLGRQLTIWDIQVDKTIFIMF